MMPNDAIAVLCCRAHVYTLAAGIKLSASDGSKTIKVNRPDTFEELVEEARTKLWPRSPPQAGEMLALFDTDDCEIDEGNYNLVFDGAVLHAVR